MLSKKYLIALTVLAQAGITQAAAPSGNYVKAWSDNFTGNTVDTKVWNFRTDSKALSVQKADNVTQVPGELDINLKPEVNGINGRYKFTAGGVVSKQAFRYGYFETQAQTTMFPGWHSAFWLFAGDGSTTYEFAASTEIDIFEIDSNTPKLISKGIIGWNNSWPLADHEHNTGRCNTSSMMSEPSYSAFHTYGAEWTEQGVNYYVDGVQVCSQAYSHADWPHDKLNIWMTSIGYQKPIAANPAENSPIRFKSVAYYVKDYYVHNSDEGYAETGSGWTASSLKSYSNQGARESTVATDSASWTPNILAEGNYAVYTWNVVDASSDPAAKYGVTDSARTTNYTVDGTNTKLAGWVSLGTHHFARGTSSKVVLKSSGSQSLRPDIVKFVRQ
jgi:beta-glucanase (GH16 family)